MSSLNFIFKLSEAALGPKPATRGVSGAGQTSSSETPLVVTVVAVSLVLVLAFVLLLAFKF